MSDNFNGCSLYVETGKTVPDDLLEALLAKYGSCGGAAYISEDGIELMKSDEKLNLNEVKQDILEPNKENNILLWFGDCPTNFSQDDVQPFECFVDEQGNAHIVCCMHGDFSEFHEPVSELNKAASDALAAFNKYVIPKLEEKWKAIPSDDFEEFVGLLKQDPLLGREMRTLAADGGAIILMASTGDIIPFVKTDTKHFDFGWATDDAGWTEKAKTEADKPAATKPRFGFRSKKVGETTVLTKEKKEETGDKKVEEAKEDDVWKRDDKGNIVMKYPPASLSHKQLRVWYVAEIGRVPKEPSYKTMPGVPVRKDGQKVSISEAEIRSFQDPRLLNAMRPAKDTAPKHIPAAPAAVEEPAVVTEPIPLIPPQELKSLINDFLTLDSVKKYLDRNSAELANDPETIQKMESKLPPFYKQAGLRDTKDVLFWPFEARLEFCKKYPTAAAVLLHDLCKAFISALRVKTTTDNEDKKDEVAAGISPPPPPPSRTEELRKKFSKFKKTG